MESIETIYPFYIAYKAAEHVFAHEGVTQTYINELLSYLFPSKFKGIYSLFDLKKISSSVTTLDSFFIVLNTLAHFVLIYVTPNEILYFDPAGGSIQRAQSHFKQKPITMFLKECFSNFPKRTLHVNTTSLQSSESVHCGFYCVLYALYFSQPSNTLKMSFQPKLKENDEKCISYTCKLIDILQP